MKVGIIGHGYTGTSIGGMLPSIGRGNVNVDIFDNSDRNITATGKILDIESYNLIGQLPITRRERRLNERKSLKHKK